MGIELTEKSIEEMLGVPTDISTLSSRNSSLSETTFNLYRETAIITILISHLYESTNSEDASLSRNQAIEAGLAVRMAKFMGGVLALMVDRVREHGEVVMALNRCLTESAINLSFFCEKAQAEDYDKFVKSSLRPERDQRKVIFENIAKRGEGLPIETRMLNSIERVFKVSGINNSDELEKIPGRKDYKEILKALNMDNAYTMLQGVPSHAIHGTWVDLVLHHLEETTSGFKPKPDTARVDARLLLPVSLLVLRALQSYVNSRFAGRHTEITIVLKRMDDLMERISKVDFLHEDRLSGNNTPNPSH